MADRRWNSGIYDDGVQCQGPHYGQLFLQWWPFPWKKSRNLDVILLRRLSTGTLIVITNISWPPILCWGLLSIFHVISNDHDNLAKYILSFLFYPWRKLSQLYSWQILEMEFKLRYVWLKSQALFTYWFSLVDCNPHSCFLLLLYFYVSSF